MGKIWCDQICWNGVVMDTIRSWKPCMASTGDKQGEKKREFVYRAGNLPAALVIIFNPLASCNSIHLCL